MGPMLIPQQALTAVCFVLTQDVMPTLLLLYWHISYIRSGAVLVGRASGPHFDSVANGSLGLPTYMYIYIYVYIRMYIYIYIAVTALSLVLAQIVSRKDGSTVG